MAVIKSNAPRPKFAGSTLHDLGDLRLSAEQALSQARAEAERLVAEAKREVERIFSESRESGFEQGKAEGFAVGLEEGRAAGEAAGRVEAREHHEVMINALEESFTAEFNHWIAARDEAMRLAERELAGIAVAIAESIVRAHVRHDPSAVLKQVEQAVSLFSRATRVTIEIAPEDETMVREALPALCAALPPESDVALRARPGITRGGCFIRSAEGSVDARIETLFRRMREGIVGTDAPVAEPESGAPAAPAVAETGRPATGEPEADGPEASDSMASDSMADGRTPSEEPADRDEPDAGGDA